VNLDLAWQALAVECGPHEGFGELDGAATLNLLQSVLLNNIRHLLLLLLALSDLLLQVIDLLVQRVEAVTVGRPVADGPNESGVWVLEWLVDI
jgi:hypothetical protein